MSLAVDAHQHFWAYGTYQTSWMEVPPYAGDPAFRLLRRSFQPDDLTPELKAAAVQYTVTIEAADDLTENKSLFAKARGHDWIAGVVGWAPLADSGELERTLDACAGKPLVGIRSIGARCTRLRCRQPSRAQLVVRHKWIIFGYSPGPYA